VAASVRYIQSTVKGCWGPTKNFRWGPQQALRQMRAFSRQLQISPLSSANSKLKQAKLIIYKLGENNFNELPMQNKRKLTLSLVSCYHL